MRDTPRRFARDLIVAVLENMRRYQEPLMYSVIAPSRYLIYLHSSEYARLEGILPLLREQTIRGLTDEVDKLNRRSTMQRYAERLVGRTALPVESATGDWQVEFLEDPDGDIAEGAFVIDSELRAPQGPELGGGSVFNLYPNPTYGSFTIETEAAGILTVFTIDGKELVRYHVSEGTTGVSLPKEVAVGVYMCRYYCEDGRTFIVRLIVQ